MPITVMIAMGLSGIGHLEDLSREYPMNLPSLGRKHNPFMQMAKVELRTSHCKQGQKGRICHVFWPLRPTTNSEVVACFANGPNLL
jgi:hypothetical protein